MRMILLLLAAAITWLANHCEAYHFVLVHGAGEGAWCWYKVSQKLKQAGHKVDAVDLVSAGRDSRDVFSVGSLDFYSSPLDQLFGSLAAADKVVLVGNSLAGLSLTLMLEKYPKKIAAAVYVTALMLPSGPIAQDMFSRIFNKFANKLTFDTSNGTTVASFQLDQVQQLLFNKSPPEDVELAKSLLKPFPQLNAVVNFTKARYGIVPRYFIRTGQDNALLVADQEDLIRRTPPKQVFQLVFSDHSPFFSHPNSLVSYLLAIAVSES